MKEEELAAIEARANAEDVPALVAEMRLLLKKARIDQGVWGSYFLGHNRWAWESVRQTTNTIKVLLRRLWRQRAALRRANERDRARRRKLNTLMSAAQHICKRHRDGDASTIEKAVLWDALEDAVRNAE